MKTYIKSFLVLLLSLGVTSCELDFNPLDKIADTTNWKTEQDVVRSVNNAYRYLSNTDIQAFISCATDDSYSWSNWPSDIQYVGNGTATASTGAFSNHWSHYYNMIAACNDVTDNIDRVNLTPQKANRYKAEVRVIRAYAYQQLTGLYGAVPLITHIQKVEEFNAKRTPVEDIVNFIAQELNEILENSYLPKSYDASDKGRVTEGFAAGLLARTMLYNGKWAEAKTAAQIVMDLNEYDIDADYLSLFDGTNKNSKEIMISAQHMKDVYPNAMGTWLGAPSISGWGQVVPLKGLIDSYECKDGLTIENSPLYQEDTQLENRDPRLKLSIVTPGSLLNGKVIDITNENSMDRLGASNASYSGYYYRKYIPADIEGEWDRNSYNDIVIMRYAEVLLTYAEAAIESNTIDESVLNAINKVRSRADVMMPAVTTKNQDELREIVRRERRVELVLEGQRLFDIRRWEIADQVMHGSAQGIYNNFDSSREDFGKYVMVENRGFNKNRDYLWPVPLNQTSINKNLLPNNPGW